MVYLDLHCMSGHTEADEERQNYGQNLQDGVRKALQEIAKAKGRDIVIEMWR